MGPVGYPPSLTREWRNWQTRRIQVPVPARAWGFKSPLAHFPLLGTRPGAFSARDRLLPNAPASRAAAISRVVPAEHLAQHLLGVLADGRAPSSASGSVSPTNLIGVRQHVGADLRRRDPAACGPGTAGRRRSSWACSTARSACCAPCRTRATRPSSASRRSSRRIARSSVLPRAWSPYCEPGQRSNRSGRPTPSQKFFQNSRSDAMNRM